jgi:formylglycine-generating enzyme required for sulfatase activity
VAARSSQQGFSAWSAIGVKLAKVGSPRWWAVVGVLLVGFVAIVWAAGVLKVTTAHGVNVLPGHDPPTRHSFTNSIGMRLTLIPAGEFKMGSSEGEEGDDDEKPQHRVRITRPFYLGVYEVTQEQYKAVMGKNPSWFSATGRGKSELAGESSDRNPVENVSWIEAVKFCNELSVREGLNKFYEIDGETVRVPDWWGPGYRLPTEAEWEYACRADSETRYSFGNDAARLREHGWFDGNSGGRTHPVGQLRANGFGLFDMHGNVWEWCWDGYDAGSFGQSPLLDDDPQGPSQAASRVIRGASWNGVPRGVRSADRLWRAPGGRGSSWVSGPPAFNLAVELGSVSRQLVRIFKDRAMRTREA